MRMEQANPALPMYQTIRMMPLCKICGVPSWSPLCGTCLDWAERLLGMGER